MMNDPLIDEIRRARREISDELGPDLAGFVEQYAEIETRFLKPALKANDHKSQVARKITEQNAQRETEYGSR